MLRVRLHVEIFLLDAIMKVFVWWAFADLLDLSNAQLAAISGRFVPLAIATAFALQLLLVPLIAPIFGWRRSGTDAAVVAAGAAASRAPARACALSTALFLVNFLPTCWTVIYRTPEVSAPPQSLLGTLLMLLGLAAGLTVLSYTYTLWALGPVNGRLSVEARLRGVTIRTHRVSLRGRNVLFALFLALGPSTWLTSLGYLSAVRAHLRRLEDGAEIAAAHLARQLVAGGADLDAAVHPEPRFVFVLDRDGRLVAGRAHGLEELPDDLVARALAGLRQGTEHSAVTDPRTERSVAVVRAGDRVAGVAARAAALPGDDLRKLALFFPAIAAYAMLAAMYLSTHMIQAMRKLAHAVKEIAGQGGVRGKGRLPVMQRDEIGVIIESANEMIDRLEEAQAASRAASESLREANTRLEQRVEERTVLLTVTNRELEDNLARLSQARSELAEAARRAGMAEVASSVLHNVGNVLNSVNVTTSLLADTLRQSKVAAVRRAVALVPDDEAAAAAFFTADSRGRVLPAYLKRIGETLAGENEVLLREVEFLQKNVDHIKVIIGLQQTHARHGGLVEPVRVADLVEDAIRFSLASATLAGLSVDRELASLPEVLTDRHRLFQILVNLLRNARDAVGARATPEQRIVVRGRAEGGGVAIEVADNGCGVAPENLGRIFNLGFTTKPDGHGYGLHSSAIAVRELGGEITVASAGEGQGTTFTVTVPARSPPPNRASAQATMVDA